MRNAKKRRISKAVQPYLEPGEQVELICEAAVGQVSVKRQIGSALPSQLSHWASSLRSLSRAPSLWSSPTAGCCSSIPLPCAAIVSTRLLWR